MTYEEEKEEEKIIVHKYIMVPVDGGEIAALCSGISAEPGNSWKKLWFSSKYISKIFQITH